MCQPVGRVVGNDLGTASDALTTRRLKMFHLTQVNMLSNPTEETM